MAMYIILYIVTYIDIIIYVCIVIIFDESGGKQYVYKSNLTIENNKFEYNISKNFRR